MNFQSQFRFRPNRRQFSCKSLARNVSSLRKTRSTFQQSEMAKQLQPSRSTYHISMLRLTLHVYFAMREEIEPRRNCTSCFYGSELASCLRFGGSSLQFSALLRKLYKKCLIFPLGDLRNTRFLMGGARSSGQGKFSKSSL